MRALLRLVKIDASIAAGREFAPRTDGFNAGALPSRVTNFGFAPDAVLGDTVIFDTASRTPDPVTGTVDGTLYLPGDIELVEVLP